MANKQGKMVSLLGPSLRNCLVTDPNSAAKSGKSTFQASAVICIQEDQLMIAADAGQDQLPHEGHAQRWTANDWTNVGV